MNNITLETQALSYQDVLANLGERQKKVATWLEKIEGKSGVTANELALAMFENGVNKTAERNNVHPRLNELVKLNLVKVVGKKICSVSGKKCAVYQTVEVGA